LILAQNITEAEEHSCVGFLELRTRLGNVIDLHQYFRFIRMIGGEQWLHCYLLFVEGGRQVDQMETALLECVFNFLLLVRGESDFLYDSGVAPPGARRPGLQCAFHGRGWQWAGAAP
jgi:hypothetical protein